MKPKKPEPDLGLWLIGMLVLGGVILMFAALMSFAHGEERPVPPGVAYCGIWAREATRIDLMHTIPVQPEDVTDAYITALAVKLFEECISILPTLLPLPEAHRNLSTWVGDMRYLIQQRASAGTVPASAAPIESDEQWRQQCAATYRTWEESTGTVVRAGNPARVKCPCGAEVVCE